MFLATITLIALGAWWALPAFSAPPEPTPTPQASSRLAAAPTAQPTDLAEGRRATSAPSAEASPAAPDRPSPTPSPLDRPTTTDPSPHSPAPTQPPDRAPASAEQFDRDRQVIRIGFPLRESTRYRYRDNWGDLRVGAAEHYNHAHSRRDGELRRAHDGIDLYARRGEPVLSPFDGTVVAPRRLWQPWHQERYGRTAVIVSSEPTSAGYVSLLSHLDRLWVEPGQAVRRGEIIGTVGSTGNAEGGRPHVHFELRAPFPLAWREVGEERLVDAFNPYPSLVAADPRRED